MSWTRLSFFYLMTYLALGGVALLLAPQLAFRLLGSGAGYPAVLGRLMGAFMVALAIVVVDIVRYRAEALYRTTLFVRVVLVGTMVWLYVDSRDPLFLTLTGIVGLGMLLTTAGLVADRRAACTR